MSLLRSASRAFALVLLILAALDLSSAAGCRDLDPLQSGAPVVCGGGHQADVGHPSDDCFCCSRTVRAAFVNAIVAIAPPVTAPSQREFRLTDGADPLPYHPPLA